VSPPTPEKIPFRRVKVGKGSGFVNRAFFAKRSPFRPIWFYGKIPVYPESGEFRENGTITFFPGPKQPRIEISSSRKKIRANTCNWTAKVFLSAPGAQDLKKGLFWG
jgi:hypothetical protein